MKKLSSLIVAMIVTLSLILSSCTENEVTPATPPTDNNGKGEHSGF